MDCNLYYGDSERELSAGAGTYTGGKIPGEGGTVLIAGHTGTYFRDFESAQLGADIAIETRYGTYHYTISDMRVVEETDASAYDLAADEENIILYTCYPFGQLSTTPYRYFIYGTPVSGPQIEQEAGAMNTKQHVLLRAAQLVLCCAAALAALLLSLEATLF